MTAVLNDTHDPARRSWVPSANTGSTDFPLQNLPLGMVLSPTGPHPCTAIGDHLVDIAEALEQGRFTGPAAQAAQLACQGPHLNALVAAGHDASAALRQGLFALLAEGSPPIALPARATQTMLLPVQAGGFTDFLCSAPHTERMGRLARPDATLPPAFKHLPIAYNGRASSLRVSGTDVARPWGQRREADGAVVFGPCVSLDFELELAAVVQGGNDLGQPLSMAAAERQVFGCALLNDWSARDIQSFEAVPLGPFLGKSLMTTLAPWIVTAEALAPFRCPAGRPSDDPPPFAHLESTANRAEGGLAVELEAWLWTARARDAGEPAECLARCDFAAMYWTFAQMVAHHASNGCDLRPGDLIGSGTVSDRSTLGRACMAEMQPELVMLAADERRQFLADGDEVLLRGRASRQGFASIGFGECRGRIMPARSFPGAQ